MIRAGKLQHRLDLQRYTETVSKSGHVKQSWETYATGKAEMRQASISEYLTDFGASEGGKAVFLIRWIAGVQVSDRIIHAGRVWNIKAIAEIGRRRGLELRAEAE